MALNTGPGANSGNKISLEQRNVFFGKIGHDPLRWQKEFHDSPARFRIACCGRRAGKSHGGGRDLEPRLFLPRNRYWIVGPTYDLGEKEFRVVWDDLIVGMAMGRDKSIRKAYNKKTGDMYIEFPWRTRLEVRSADHPENLVGEALDGVIMSEAAKHKKETWERFIRPALSDKRGWGTFLTTPEGFNWLYELWLLGQDPSHPEFDSWQYPSWLNEKVYPGGRQDPEILLLERTTTAAWFAQEIGAEFGAFVGKIFSEWQNLKHVRETKFNPDWPSYAGIDWGWTRPFAFIEFQISPDDRVHVWREYYEPYHTIEEHVAALKARPNPEGYHLDLCFADAAEPQSAMYFSQHFCPTVADPDAKKNRYEGYELVGRFLKGRPLETKVMPANFNGIVTPNHPEGLGSSGGDNALVVSDEYGTPLEIPGLQIDHSCVKTIHEFNMLRAPDAPNGTRSVELAPKSEDHAIDALRYGLVHIFVLGANAHLGDVYTSSDFQTEVTQGLSVAQQNYSGLGVSGTGTYDPTTVAALVGDIDWGGGETYFRSDERF
jgi:hypothetical protein